METSLALLFDAIIVLFSRLVVCNKETVEVHCVKFRNGEETISMVPKLSWILVETLKLFFLSECVTPIAKPFCVVGT